CRWIQIGGRDRNLQENIIAVNDKKLTIRVGAARSARQNEIAPIKWVRRIGNCYPLIIPKSNWGIKMCVRTIPAPITTGYC
ncbi:hypothetical protein, partial [Mesorhizobium sp.]|uniref:hypothetical protein n=1 Tax=Mesorhizobium sp. TaxID=1871066 RepID=UPI00257F32D4